MADDTPIEDQGAPEPVETQETFEPSETGRRERHLGRTIAKWTAIVLGGIVLLVGALILGLDTGPGKRFVADQIAGLEFQNGMEIDVGRIEGSLYGEMVLHDVAVSDPKGVFLTSPEMRVDWRPFKFLRSHIDIRALTAERVTLARAPEFAETPPSDDPLLPNYDIDIGTFRIANFVAEAPVSGERRGGRISPMVVRK